MRIILLKLHGMVPKYAIFRDHMNHQLFYTFYSNVLATKMQKNLHNKQLIMDSMNNKLKRYTITSQHSLITVVTSNLLVILNSFLNVHNKD